MGCYSPLRCTSQGDISAPHKRQYTNNPSNDPRIVVHILLKN